MSDDTARDAPREALPIRPLGLAHLSLIERTPTELIAHAAQAGFDFVGIRVRAVTDRERPFDLSPGSPLALETRSRMADTGVTVRDIEFLLLDGSDQRDDWMRMFEAGQALGAQTLTVASADTEPNRAADTLGRIVQDGRGYGITPTIEPISYQAVNSVPQAAALARVTGCGIVIDALHLARFRGTLAEVADAAELIPLVQLCDAPTARPDGRDGLVHESRAARLAPGDGELRPHDALTVLDACLPVSAEVPNDDAVGRMGAQGWADHLFSAVRATVAPREGARP